MKFSEDFVEKVREANDIVTLISEYTSLKKTGSEYFGLCPFPEHSEKTPSFAVNPAKQLFHCFGCKKGGNTFHFLQNVQGFTFSEAVEFLARRARLALPAKDLSSSLTKEEQTRKQLYHTNRLAALFYHQQLKKIPSEHHCRVYMKTRNMDQNMIELFGLGYAPDQWQGFISFLNSNKGSITCASQLGLIKMNTLGEYFDIFRNRLIFPIINPLGDIVGFGARSIKKEDQPKYLNSHESLIFQKSKVLFGLNKTIQHIKKKDHIILVEGYTDLLSLYSNGFKNVAATLGTALTFEHAVLIKKYTKHVILLFDGDSAGQEASFKSLGNLLEAGLYPKICTLPDELDPDEFLVKYGGAQLQLRLDQSADLFYAYCYQLMKDYNGGEGDKIKLIDQLVPILNKISDRQLLTLYVQELAGRLLVDQKWIYSSLNSKKERPLYVVKSHESTADTIENKEAKSKISLQKAPKLELYLLKLALESAEQLEWIIKSQVETWLTHQEIKKIYHQIVESHRQTPENFDKLMVLVVSQLENPGVLTMFINKQEITADKFEQVRGVIQRLRDNYLKNKARELAMALKVDPSPEQLVQFMNVQKDRRIKIDNNNRSIDDEES